MVRVERNRLIHEKVFGNPAICIGKLIVNKKGTPSRAGGIAWTYYQTACTNCEFERSYTDNAQIPEQHAPMGDIPPYSTDLNAAWLVVRRMNNPDGPAHSDYQGYVRFIEELEKIVGSNLFFDLFYCDHEGDHLTSDRICLAALKARGVEIEP